MQFNEVLSLLMKETHTSNYKLAKSLNVSQTSVANWITGTNVPRQKMKAAIARYFSVSIKYLETGDPEQKEKLAVKDSELQEEASMLFSRMTPDAQKMFLVQMRSVVAAQEFSADSHKTTD